MIRIYENGNPEELNEEMSLVERSIKKGLLKFQRDYDTIAFYGKFDDINIFHITDSSFTKGHKRGIPILVSVDNKKPRALDYRERLYVIRAICSQL